MNQLLIAGYVEVVMTSNYAHGRVWYLSHQPVVNPNKPEKTRIVFDCAVIHNGVALNQMIHQGPDLTNK